jgi:hypothetical protein
MSLILRWAMEDTATGVVEDPTGACPLTAYGLPPFIAGPSALGGRARAFNSLPAWTTGLPVQYATNRTAPAGVRATLVGSNYTFSCWIRPQDGADYATHRIVTFGHSSDPDDLAGLYMQDAARLYWYSMGWNTSRSTAWVYDAWNHVVARKHGLFCDLWINGVEVFADEQFEPTFAGVQSPTGAFLACDRAISEGVTTAIGACFSGGIDEVRLYDTALTDAQVAELYAGGDPEAIAETSTAAPDAATEAAAHLASLSPIVDNLSLTVGRNLFVGPERATRAEVPDFAVFAQNVAGGPPQPYVNNRYDFARLAVQLLVRSAPGQFAQGELLARNILSRLHREKPTGYVTCLSQQAGPTYLGEDEGRRHRWALNFELWWKG